jgi:hypothetical protein
MRASPFPARDIRLRSALLASTALVFATSLPTVGLAASAAAVEELVEALDIDVVHGQVEALRKRAFDSILAKERRIFEIGERLRSGAMGLCPKQQRPIWGVLGATERELASVGLKDGRRARDLSKALQVLWVQPGSPADRGGIEMSDVIVSVGRQRIGHSSDLYRVRLSSDAEQMTVYVRRKGRSLERKMPLEFACFAGAALWLSDIVNAAQGDRGVYLTAGALRFAKSDDELALFLGHELAHAILHQRRLQQSRRAYRESDADYLGLYIAARAGYDLQAARGLWRRMSTSNPYRLTARRDKFRSHPRSPARALALEATIQEITEKRRDGLPIEPESPE